MSSPTFGHSSIRNTGVRVSAAASAFRDPDDKRGETEANIREAGDDAQRHGRRIEAFADIAKSVLSALGALASVFQSDPPTQVNLRESEEPDDIPDEAPSAEGRILPRPPAKRLPTSVPEEVTPTPAPHPGAPAPGAPDAGHRDGPDETPSQPPHAQAAPDDAPAGQAPRPSSRQPARIPDAMLPARPPPGRQPPSVDRAPPTAPKPVPEDSPEDRLKGLPEVLHPRVLALGDRPLREVLYALILDICRLREWTTAKELARWFSMHRRSLVNRHLGPMVDAGLLELRFPNSPRSPQQAYRARRAETPNPIFLGVRRNGGLGI